jgi:probable addiction module antidote protein
MPKPRVLDAAKFRDDPAAIAEHLNDALSTEDPDVIIKAIGDMVRAQGVTRFAQKAGMRRDSLYRTFNGRSSAPFDRVLNALIALDIELKVKPDRQPSRGLKAK